MQTAGVQTEGKEERRESLPVKRTVVGVQKTGLNRRRKKFKRDIYHQKKMETKDSHQEEMSDTGKPCSA